MKPENLTRPRNLTRDQRSWLYCCFTVGVIILVCVSGFWLRNSSWRFTAEVLVVLAANGITYGLFGKRLWVCRNKIWRDESGSLIVLSNGLSFVGDILLSLIYLAHYGDAEARQIFDGMSFFNGRFFLDLINLWWKVPVLSLGLPAVVVCCVAIACLLKLARLLSE